MFGSQSNRSADEWEKLAAWVCDNKVFSPNVRWLVQVPRLYTVYKQSGIVNNFEDVLRSMSSHASVVGRAPGNALTLPSRPFIPSLRPSVSRLTRLSSRALDLFKPLYDVTLDPSSSPKLHQFLQQVVGFDSVDDESKPVRRIHKK